MKVIVRCANNRITKADMEREIERLFQENKNLRLGESHLKDELNIVRQQSEARRQVICERDKLIQELNEQIQASEDELENTHCDLVNQKQLQEEMCDTIDDLRIKLANAENKSSQDIRTVAGFWEKAVNEKVKAEERAEEYHIALMESDCQVDELEKRIEYLENELEQTEAIANQVIEERDELREEHEKDLGIMRKLDAKIEELSAELVKHKSKHYQQEAEEWKMTANKLDERVQDLNAQLRDVQADYNELSDDYSDVQKINRDYAQEIDRLRKLVTELQTHRFTVGEIQNMICKYLEGFEPSAASFNF